MSKDVYTRKEANVKYRDDLTVYEYPRFSGEVDIVYAELNGRHPLKGYIINETSDETYLVYQGKGTIYMDGRLTEFKAGDIVPIKRGTKYYCIGENMKFYCAINPVWSKEQEKLIEN